MGASLLYLDSLLFFYVGDLLPYFLDFALVSRVASASWTNTDTPLVKRLMYKNRTVYSTPPPCNTLFGFVNTLSTTF